MANQDDYFTKLMKNVSNHGSTSNSVAYIAKIIGIKPPTATLKPLAMPNNKKLPEISKAHFMIQPTFNRIKKLNEPFSKSGKSETDAIDYDKDKMMSRYQELDYQKGDNVVVLCLDYDDMYFKDNDRFKVTASTMHSMDYSIIIGRYAKKDDFKI